MLKSALNPDSLTMKKIVFTALLFVIAASLFGQESRLEKQREQFYSVLDYMYEEQYDKALDLLYHLDSVKLEPFVKDAGQRLFAKNGDTVSIEKIYVKYLIAACYLEDQSKTQKPLEYIEFVINSGYSDTPEIVYKDLGDLYHRDYQFDKAIFYYKKFLQETNKQDIFYEYAKNKIEVSQQARKILKDTIDAPIFELNDNINSPHVEKMPLISSDHSILVFDYTRYEPSATDQKNISYYAIKVCHKHLGLWQKAREVELTLPKGKNHYQLAGLSPDARFIYLAIAEDANSPKDLYQGELRDYRIENLREMSALNTEADENAITVEKNYQRAYFSSNRKDGKGRYDLYVAEKGNFQDWKNIRNLQEPINTAKDEINPFLHPEKPVLYFSSNGHEGAGELDIFYSGKKAGKWQEPQNIGFPINTVVNNYSVSVNPKLNKVYFALEKSRDYSNLDIYSTSLDAGIPYTALSGLLLSEDADQPVSATIKVSFANQDQNDIIVTRQPNKNGNYLIFFPPGNVYRMLIQAQGYKTRLIRFRVPEQNYYYQLRQKIMIDPIKLLGEKVGERFELNNFFHDVPHDTSAISQIQALKSSDQQQKMQDVVERIVEYNKEKDHTQNKDKKYQELMGFIDESIQSSDSTALRKLKEKANYDKKVTDRLYYKAGKNQTAKQVTLDGKTYEVTQQIDLTDEKLNAREVSLDSLVESYTIAGVKEKDTLQEQVGDKPNKIADFQVFFASNAHRLSAKYKEKLDEIADFLVDNPGTEVVIDGYANDIGSEQPNYMLSQKRAKAVEAYLIAHNVAQNRIRTDFHGELASEGAQALKQNRKADIVIFSNKY